MSGLRIGVHTSRSGGLAKSAFRARDLGANAFQIFSASPRMWRATAPHAEEVRQFQDARERFDLFPLAIHGNYLINLASLDPVIRRKSIAAFRGELQRAATLGAEYLVTHPGSSMSSSAEQGMGAFARGFRDAACGLNLGPLTVLLENTVGCGTQLGGRLTELKDMRDLAGQICDVPVGYCLDTCHLHASGLDLATRAGLKETVAAIEGTLGMANVKLVHANDSKGARGSRLDRHANIGAGTIGLDGFRGILRHPGFRSKPFILETPADDDETHRRDIDTLKELAVALKRETSAKRRSQNNAGKGVRLPGNRA